MLPPLLYLCMAVSANKLRLHREYLCLCWRSLFGCIMYENNASKHNHCFFVDSTEFYFLTRKIDGVLFSMSSADEVRRSADGVEKKFSNMYLAKRYFLLRLEG